MADWYVVNCNPHQEARAEANLRSQGYDAWLPKLLRSRRHARRIDTTSAPLFPGYLFIRIDPLMQRWRAINSTMGVRRLLCHGEWPSPVEPGFVEALRETVNADGVVAPTVDSLKFGQRVRLLAGPFVDCMGTLLSLPDHDRVALLLNLLGREVKVVVSRREVLSVA